MWYRFSQNILKSEVTKAPFEEAKIKTHPNAVIPSSVSELTVSTPSLNFIKPFRAEMTLAEFEEDIEDTFNKMFKVLQPSKLRDSFALQFKQMMSNRSDKNTELTSKDFNHLQNGYRNLFQQMNNEIQKQAISGLEKLVKKRDSGYYDNQLKVFISTDKVLQDYLGAQMNDDIISAVNLQEDVTEIARFFIMNSTDPRFSKIKLILQKIPVAGWGTDVISLVTNFYINYKLTDLINLVQQRQPKTYEDETLIALLKSKIHLNSMKIGVSLNNVLNRNQFGQLLGQISSTALQGVEGLQNLMGTNKDIQDLIYNTPATKPK